MGSPCKLDPAPINPLGRSLRKVLLDRDRQLELLATLLAGVESTGGQVVLIRGEAGIGKSSLVNEFVARHTDTAHIHVGYCDDLLTPQPFDPLWDIAREEPALHRALTSRDRQLVMESLIDLLMVSLRPAVLVVEDTHWSDNATLDAIRYVGRRIARTNGLLVLTYRDKEIDLDHPLRMVIGELPPRSVTRIELRGLPRWAVKAMVGDSDLDPDRVLEATHGNPFFVTELVSAGSDEVPSSVRESVMARVRKLSPEGRELLALLSVIPERTPADHLPLIAGRVSGRLAECEKVGLLEVTLGLVAFRHELVRRAVEASLTISESVGLHRRLLDLLPPDTDPARLVHHALGATDVARLVEFAPMAARAAAAVGGYRESAAHFRAIEPWLDRFTTTEQAALLIQWAEIEYYLDSEESIEILDRAINLHQREEAGRELAMAHNLGVGINEAHGKTEAARHHAAEAVRIMEPGGPSADLAFTLARLADFLLQHGEGIRAGSFADRAISIAETTGNELTLIIALNVKGTLAYVRGERGGLELIEQVRSRAERGQFRFEEARALLRMAVVALEIRDMDRASDFAQRAREAAVRYQIPILETEARSLYAEVLLRTGAWEEAEDLAAETLGSHAKADTRLNWILGTLRIRTGRSSGLKDLELSLSLAEESEEIEYLLGSAAALAEMMWLRDVTDPERVERFLGFLHRGLELEFPWPAGSLAYWMWKLGALSELPGGLPTPYLDTLEGRTDDAAEFWRSRRMPYEVALALMVGDSRAQLEALEVLETLGAIAVAAKLRQSLRNQGLSVPRGRGRKTRTHGGGLTARQAEVLGLLEQGLTNLEIADHLFVSPRTVENHVSAVMTKLDAGTRDEAVLRARAAGLLTASPDR